MSSFLPIFVGIFLLDLFPIFLASYCGESAIPFSFEVLPNGNPVLGCARPNCFGWNAFGQPIRANESNFYRVDKQPDGFFRKALTANMPKPFSEKEAPFYRPQNATCYAGFKRGRCSASGGHWVGGIAPNSDGENNSLLLRCCQWTGLAQSADRGIATVQNGQIVYGGEVLQGDRQYAFDYISDIFRVKGEEKAPHYEVAIYRMACLPRPERLTANVEPGVLKEMVHKFAISAQEDLQLAKPKTNPLEGQKPTKQRHKGESRVIKTSKWTASPVDNEPEEENGQNGQQSEKQNIHLGGINKAFAAPIQGPFVENEIDKQRDKENGDYEGEEIGPIQNSDHFGISPQTQQNDGQFGQNGHYEQPQNQFGYNNYAAPSNGAGESAVIKMATKKRIICDRNVTRSRSRAVRQACEEVEVEVPEGTQVQINNNEGNYYDPNAQTYQQSSWYYYYPSAGARQCFTGDTKVRVGGNGGGEMRRMDELGLGDWVLSTNQSHIVYSIVESWIHRVPKQWADFVQIELEDGRVLKLTEKHFLYKRSNCGNQMEDGPIPVEKIHTEGEMVYAKEVKAGDCLFGHGENTDLALIFEQRVKKIGIVREQGIYAPMTGTGDIFVEGILASCYAIESSPVLQKTVFNSWKSSPQIIESIFGHFNADEMNLPGWLHFMVEHLMPVVLPK